MSQNKAEILERALERQKKARKEAEKILENKSLDLYNTSQELKQVNEKLELLLKEKTSLLKGVFRNINDAYLIIDLKGKVLKINKKYQDLFGYNLKNESLNASKFFFKEDYHYAYKSFKKLINNGHFLDYASKVITKNNEVKWVNINASIIYDKFNNPVAAQGIIKDVTLEREEKRILDLINKTAKSILGKEDIFEIASEISKTIANYLETDDCVIYLLNNEKKVLDQIARFSKNEHITKEAHDKVSFPFNKGIIGEVAKTGKSEIVNDTSKDKRYMLDDDYRLSEITVPIISDGKVIAVIDSEYKLKNYFTKKHIKTLENIASLVAVQLKSAINLREIKKVQLKNKELLTKLAKSNEELNEYAHIVSHDLKSPLRSIAALTTWIKTDNQDKFDANSLQNFNDIEFTLETMETLISDILRYSSLDAVSEEIKEVDLDILIKDLNHILYIPENITINVLHKLPIVQGDKIKYQQIFQNLIGNAIKFNDKEKGIINIDVENQNSFYKFSVSDNGIGIEKKYFDKIFKIFQSLKLAKNSSGIGLSIVKKIVDIYKGEIWLVSEINKGTTFYFTIKKNLL
jgi:PAS domain S-box-containing protein